MDAVADTIAALEDGEVPDRDTLKAAVRGLLRSLAEKAPGHSVEVRVPPVGAVQCVEGPRHRRGTPPNVIECEPIVFFEIATGRLGFADAVAAGKVTASGQRADLSEYLPIAHE
ncbi:sterol carrier family protein [Glycomyces sp. L485]|uniref:sterol carrier family protein n=1 Tax=Glycomyces sp. L485 TaxID=2909235 RepID=UPI001F4B25F6|nr:sterol carrier family protein [Glycomyces sp. L485]MCH7229731.1 sterol carrier family protein [Glycomyces sp. L485]